MATRAMTGERPEEPRLEIDAAGARLRLLARGDWVIDSADRLERLAGAVRPLTQTRAEIDLAGLRRLDTVGAWLLYRIERALAAADIAVDYHYRTDTQRRIVEQVRASDSACAIEPPEEHILLTLIEDIGVATVRIVTDFGALLAFLGNVFLRIGRSILHPSRIRLTPLVHQIEVVGFRAIPIVGLLSFLIGAVVVNQGAVQLRKFGAEILVTDLVSFGFLRELGGFLAAIILAGRSGSAFAAEIGSMVMREEVDALKTLGINPIDVLVLPRLVAMVLVLPLLTFFSDIMGLLGGAIMAWLQLGLTVDQFINRLAEMSLLRELYIGLIKSLFFAGVIAISGCFQGMTVEGTAESLGRNTTAAVVESIFLVIVLDAFFAVFFTTIGW
ncbi:MAG: ABC transporter permease [Alphaproteobacteria bacterium]|nr:MAG: ABC transporter permease [Alphaproteobacteria bacterium]